MRFRLALLCCCLLTACDGGAAAGAPMQGPRPRIAVAPEAARHRFDEDIAAATAEVRAIYVVPPALVRAVIQQESSWRPAAVSRVGARGLMQVMPSTAIRLGVQPDDLWEPRVNIRAGVRLLAVLLRHYKGDVISCLVAYNARPRRLFAPVPRNGETPNYVWRVLSYYEDFRAEEAQQP